MLLHSVEHCRTSLWRPEFLSGCIDINAKVDSLIHVANHSLQLKSVLSKYKIPLVWVCLRVRNWMYTVLYSTSCCFPLQGSVAVAKAVDKLLATEPILVPLLPDTMPLLKRRPRVQRGLSSLREALKLLWQQI